VFLDEIGVAPIVLIVRFVDGDGLQDGAPAGLQRVGDRPA
jgi:hypothetical protein